MIRYKQSTQLFFYLLLLTVFFLLAEISFFVQCYKIYFEDFNLISQHIAVPAAIIPGVLFFIFAQLVVHAVYLLIIWTLTLLLADFFKCTLATTEKMGIVLWLFSMFAILIANQYLFPNSRFADLTSFIFVHGMIKVLYMSVCIIWAIVLLIAAYTFAVHNPRKMAGLLIFSILITAYWEYQRHFNVTTDAGTEERPNIILIGIDAVRPDFIASLKPPFFTEFLGHATVFGNTFTPLARTFPSWVSILSGYYPKESGVRFDLANPASVSVKSLLTTILHQRGYQTIYATDETRFSNMDQSFGFDQLITPPMGLNDFLLGTFNDFPLSNLIINTFIGKWLFPYSYANRPAYATYDPNSFINLMAPYLKQPRHQPLFLSVHFCLPHYPYLWASHAEWMDNGHVNRYSAALLRADLQLQDFMAQLERYQVLNHALVVLLSDHGEALELVGDRITSAAAYVRENKVPARQIPRFYPPSADKEAVDQSAGHGTDVLGFTQYHSLLAFRLYGLGKQVVKSVNQITSLLDIKPTIVEFLHIKDKNSGLSLWQVIKGHANSIPERSPLFLESDFSPEAVHSVHPETRNLVFEGIEYFAIDPKTTRIFVKASMGKLIISSKQYANVDHDWVLALYPRAHNKMTPVLVQLSTGKWTTDLGTSFAQRSPAQRMIVALQKFYGGELRGIYSQPPFMTHSYPKYLYNKPAVP